MKPKYTTKTDEINNETFYFKDGVEIDPTDETEELCECNPLQRHDPTMDRCNVCGKLLGDR